MGCTHLPLGDQAVRVADTDRRPSHPTQRSPGASRATASSRLGLPADGGGEHADSHRSASNADTPATFAVVSELDSPRSPGCSAGSTPTIRMVGLKHVPAESIIARALPSSGATPTIWMRGSGRPATDRTPRTLSYDQKQRIAFLLALAKQEAQERARQPEAERHGEPSWSGWSGSSSSSVGRERAPLDMSRPVRVRGYWRQTKSGGRTYVRPHTRNYPR